MSLKGGSVKISRWTALIQMVRLMSGLKKNLTEKEPNSIKYSKQEKKQEKEDWIREKDARNWALTRLGHEGLMLDKIQRQNKIVENTVKGLQKDSNMTASDDGEDDTGVSIGNETRTENHYHSAEKKPTTPWLPLSILAAGAMTGAGLYFGNQSDDESVINPEPPRLSQELPEKLDIGVGFGTPQIIPLKEEGSEENQ